MTTAPDRRLIAIEGLPGSGYADFARWIGGRSGWHVDCEDTSQWESKPRASRPALLSALLQRLLDRYERAQALVGTDLFRERLVIDHTFATHLLWAQALLPEREWTLYRRIAGVITPPVVVPDLVVYLQAPEGDLLTALHRLNRTVESERWRDLITAYSHHFFAYDQSPLLVVRTQSSAWLESDGAREALWERILTYPGGRTYLSGEADLWSGGRPGDDA